MMTVYIYLGAALCGGMWFLSNRRFREGRGRLFGLWSGLLLLAALVLRLLLGYYSDGFSVDIGTFKSWAYTLNKVGFAQIYQQDMFLDYPPGYLYILMLLEKLRLALGLAVEGQAHTLLMKLPSIFADLLCGGALLWLGRRKLGDRGALAVAAAYLFCPAVFVNSAQWGQADSFCTLILLASMLLLYREWYVPAGVVYGLAVICKPQMLVFAPLYLCFAIKRKKWLGLGLGVACALGAILLVATPFTHGFNYWWLVVKYQSTMNYYDYYAVNACNFWTLISYNWRGLPGPGVHKALLTLAAPVLATAACGVLMFRSRRKDAMFGAAPVLMGIVYIFSIKMHERYLFPAFLCMLIAFLFTRDKRMLRAYGLLTAANYLNVSYVLWLFREHGGNYDPNGLAFRLIAVLQIAALGYLLWSYYQVYVRGQCKEAGQAPAWASASNGQEAAGQPEGPGKRRKGRPQPAAPAPQPLGLDAGARKMALPDWLVMGGITLVYGLVAFWNLGGTVLPTTNWTPQEGESVVLQSQEIADSLIFLPGLVPDANHYAARVGAAMQVESSLNGKVWADCGTIEKEYVFAWKSYRLSAPGKYVRLTALDGSVTISEAGLLSTGALSAQPITAEGPGAQFLCDEQDTVPPGKTYENSSYFDEIYHARTAYEHILGLEPYENTHPPLGKHIIALGIRMFGLNPFGWRFMGTLFGVLMLPALYHLCKNLFGKTWLCGLGTLLFAFDFMHFTQTRIATIDTYSVFFLLLMYDAMVSFCQRDIVKDSMKRLLLPLGLSGIFMGLGVASKWTAAYGAVGLAVLFFGKLVASYRAAAKSKGGAGAVVRRSWQLCLWCCLLFVAIPFGIYFCAFLPMTTLPHNQGKLLWSFSNYQSTMFNYHSKLVAEHSFASTWYEWPLDVRPIWFYGNDNADGSYSTISSMGNPLLWWGCIPALVFALWHWLKKRDLPCGVALTGFLSVYLPWVLVPRLTFIYHYFTAVPFLVLCLLAAFRYMEGHGPLSAQRWQQELALGGLRLRLSAAPLCLALLAVASLILFAVYFPVISGMPTTRQHVKDLAIFSTWYFG
ncbi:glycosyltransferase family 39 protein [Acutalibacter caecimuris]|uniref:glycosyltransferase family 39 protein n=1 Tax=Acutalibacter caecimuris TaxID=3093657 RepID=UPI002AC8E083|nr:glycosyltransferase family 39 protein [Acutalibacter sp. M00118]